MGSVWDLETWGDLSAAFSVVVSRPWSSGALDPLLLMRLFLLPEGLFVREVCGPCFEASQLLAAAVAEFSD
jgi:hypothetical protein